VLILPDASSCHESRAIGRVRMGAERTDCGAPLADGSGMSPRRAVAGWFFAALLSASVVHAEGMRVAPASAPPSVAMTTRKALETAIESDLANRAEDIPEGYTLFPRLLELRRYVEGGAKRATLVCVVELTLVADADGKVAGRTRASANSSEAKEKEVVGAAGHAATERLSSTLAALARAQRDGKEPVARR